MPYSEAQKRATMKYREKAYTQITLDVPKETKEKWKARAAERNMALTAYIRELIEKDIERSDN